MLRFPNPKSKVLTAVFASAWMYVGRVLGLLWTAIVVANLNVADYGQYAMAFSASGIVVGLIDNVFLVRSIRVSDRGFYRERRTRSAYALVLMVSGLCLFNWNFVVGFAVIIAGGEIGLNALKSWSLRNGKVQNVMLLDLIRQALSIVAGTAYLAFVENPSVEIASLSYAIAYVIAVLLACLRYGIRFAGMPGRPRETAILSLGALAGAGYAQGDVLLLGLIAGEAAAGTYSIASMVAWAAAGLFLNHANSHVAEMRSGRPGASIKRIVIPACSLAIATLGASLLITYVGLLDPLGPTLSVLSVFVLLRAINHVCTVALTVARKDLTRTSATIITALFDLALVWLFASSGSLGAAIAAVVSEFLLLSIYLYAYNRLALDVGQKNGVLA